MWLLMAGSTENVDYNNYLMFYNFYSNNIFNLTTFPGVEIGFSLLMKLTNLIGLSYNGFLGVYALLGLCLLGESVKKYSNIKYLPILFYLFYQYFLDAVQIRNFLAMAIFIYSIRYLVNYCTTNQKKDLFMYILSILFAASFHITALYYLIFIFLVKITNKKLLISFSIVTITLYVFRSQLLSLIALVLNDTKYIAYLYNPTALYGVVFYTIYIYASIFITLKIRSRILNSDKTAPFVLQFSSLTVKINIAMILTIFLFSFRPDFVRLYRNILFLNYILIAISMNPGKISINRNNLLTTILFFLYFLCSAYVFLWFSNLEGMVWPLLEMNKYF